MRVPVSPLLGSELRVRRARQLVGVLKRQSQQWAEAHRDFIDAVKDEAGKYTLAIARADAERAGRMSITIGETVYNLRSALDFMVYDIACVASGKDVRGTQFPIENDAAMFQGRVTGKRPDDGRRVAQFLRGVPQSAVHHIERLQPFAGCPWTRDLRELSNRDKHRRLSSLRSNVSARVKEAKLVPDPATPGKGSLEIRYDAEVELFLLDHGGPVQERLEELCVEVGKTIAFFKQGFQSTSASA